MRSRTAEGRSDPKPAIDWQTRCAKRTLRFGATELADLPLSGGIAENQSRERIVETAPERGCAGRGLINPGWYFLRSSLAAERRSQQDLVPAAQPIDLANMRPVGQRLPPELVEAAKRFVIDFRDGHIEQIAGEMEPALYALLEWLAQQSMLEAEKRRKPEEVGREILGYRDANTSRGVAYGALWAALVRAEAVYSRADRKTINPVVDVSPGKQRGRG